MPEWFDSIDWHRTLMLIGIIALAWHVAVGLWAWKISRDLGVRHLVLAPGLLLVGLVAVFAFAVFGEAMLVIERMKGE